MEAGTRLFYSLIASTLLAIVSVGNAQAANFRTQNFIVQAPTPQLANAVGVAAEKYRRELAHHWIGTELRPWPTPCPIRVVAGPSLAAQGVTTYNRAPVRDFQMEVVGTPERILDSVLPHEVTHTILASHFGRPLPRWADEGICTTVEHAAERNKHEAKLREFLKSRRGIAMNQLFLLTEYPNDVLPMYAQGYSVCRFLIDQKGPRTFIQFLHDYMQHPSWTANVKKHYDYDSLAELQKYWLAWVADGSGPVEKFAKVPPRSPSQSTPSTNDIAANHGNAVATLNESGRDRPEMAPATSLASTTGEDAGAPGQGWYLRQRDQPSRNAAPNQTPSPVALASATGSQTAGPGSSRPNAGAIRAIAPPSVVESGPYSAAQPQPEQQISRGGIPTSGIRYSDATRPWATPLRR